MPCQGFGRDHSPLYRDAERIARRRASARGGCQKTCAKSSHTTLWPSEARLLVAAEADVEGSVCGGTLLSMAAKHGRLAQSFNSTVSASK